MEDDQIQRVRTIQLSMEESARPGFDDNDIQHLHVLVRLTVQFYDYLSSAPPSDDPFRDMTYAIDSIFFNIDSFRSVMHSYGVLVGSTTSTIDWNAISTRLLKDEFVSVYRAFVTQTNFESKCRLLLDLVKLQIVFAGVFYDCLPQM
jgi:hypothetical protein